MYVRPLRATNPPIITGEKDRLETWIDEVFHNYYELLEHHRRLVQAFHEIQREQHPVIRSITAPMMDAALNFREAYMEYIPNYPIAAYRIDDEMANNPAFRDFVTVRRFLFLTLLYPTILRAVCTATNSSRERASFGHEELHQSSDSASSPI